ncbi:MAG: RpoL/Rpb11 RNA polymerase subunit family protein [Candidatus Bathyarchaeia archaeon]
MKLRIVKRGPDRLMMEVGEEGHTLLNLLQSLLLKMKDVKMAGYSKSHPLMNKSVLTVITKNDKPPEEALLEASESAKNMLEEFLSEFEKQSSSAGDRP